MAIEAFTGKNHFLSNFHPVNISFEGAIYPSVEHAYQAAKVIHPGQRAVIRNALTPGAAKRLGRAYPLRRDWSDMRVSTMHAFLHQKFQREDLRAKLLATGSERLVEGNTWGDTFWGVCNGRGENKLGQLLMAVREEIKRCA